MIKRLLKEPLLHFLLLGAALFAAHGMLSRGGTNEPGKIIVTQGQIESMTLLFERTWQRLPSDAELQELIRGYVREEVFYREGLSLGLDRDDPIVRRRIAQKFEFVAEAGDAAEPNDKELQAYLEAHSLVFGAEPLFTFRHVYLDPRRREKTLSADAERMLNELNTPGSQLDAADLGDPTTLPLNFDSARASNIRNSLGEKFVKALVQIAPGRWVGPVESSYGMHLVEVSERTEPRVPALGDVRDAVKREWERARRVAAGEKSYQDLLRRYTVTIEPPRLARSASGDRARGQQ